MAEAALKCGLDYGHGIFGSIEEAVPCGFEGGLSFDHAACDLRPGGRWCARCG